MESLGYRCMEAAIEEFKNNRSRSLEELKRMNDTYYKFHKMEDNEYESIKLKLDILEKIFERIN